MNELNLFHHLDAFRRKNRFNQWLGIGKINNFSIETAKQLLSAFEKIKIPNDFLKKNNGKMIAEYIEQQRLEKLQNYLNAIVCS